MQDIEGHDQEQHLPYSLVTEPLDCRPTLFPGCMFSRPITAGGLALRRRAAVAETAAGFLDRARDGGGPTVETIARLRLFVLCCSDMVLCSGGILVVPHTVTIFERDKEPNCWTRSCVVNVVL